MYLDVRDQLSSDGHGFFLRNPEICSEFHYHAVLLEALIVPSLDLFQSLDLVKGFVALWRCRKAGRETFVHHNFSVQLLNELLLFIAMGHKAFHVVIHNFVHRFDLATELPQAEFNDDVLDTRSCVGHDHHSYYRAEDNQRSGLIHDWGWDGGHVVI